jgi:predicted GH43/DUF377 family glycosyl hydrolase
MIGRRLASVFIALVTLILLPELSRGSDVHPLEIGKLRPPDPSCRRYRPGDPDLMAHFDFEGPVMYNPDQDVKDHSLIFVDDIYHIFYIVANERNFGHATSTDLVHWTFHEPVLHKGQPGDWDEKDIWAPCVVPMEGTDGYYLMYYTGVNSSSAQQTGIAYSYGDLNTWNKIDEGITEPFACDPAWCNWDENSYSHFRDPNFFEDESGYYLTQTTRTSDDYGAVALTSSSDARFSWNDAGPMYVHENWHLLESTFVLKREGTYHLFFTEEAVGGVSHMFSDSLKSGWDIDYRWIIDSGHAAEITHTPSGADIISRHTSYLDYTGDHVYSIRFDTLIWSGGGHPMVDLEPPLGGWTILSGTAFDHQPVFGNAFAFRGDDTTKVGFEGNWWIGTAERFDGPLFGYRPGSMQGDGPRGAIRSRPFIVTGRSMRLLVGGGNYPDSCYVAIMDNDTDLIFYKETGRGVEAMDERFWNLEPIMGREVTIIIVDDCSSPMGHINVDSIEELPFPQPAGMTSPPYGQFFDMGNEDQSQAAAHVSASEQTITPLPAGEVSCYPNPFNPVTTISFTASPNSVVEVVVFSIAGKRIRTEIVMSSDEGTGSVVWEGMSDGGRRVASGMYIAAAFANGRVIGMTKLVLLK